MPHPSSNDDIATRERFTRWVKRSRLGLKLCRFTRLDAWSVALYPPRQPAERPRGGWRTGGEMAETVARRLAFLEGIDLAPSEIEEIAGELGQFEQALAALEPFADESAWPVAQAQPYRATHQPPQPPNTGGSPAAGSVEVDAGTGAREESGATG